MQPIDPPKYDSSFNKDVFDQIEPGTTCLDVGCWTGNIGQKLINEKNCTVDGIDRYENVLEKAKLVGYRNLFKFDLNQDIIDLGDNRYDIVIFADVLEHTINPQEILRNLKKYVKPTGKIIISVPNVAFILNRLLLLVGKWDYTQFGTLDNTHLRFFTIKTGRKLVSDAGYNVEKVKPYYQFSLKKYIWPLVKFLPNLFAYQLIVIGKP